MLGQNWVKLDLHVHTWASKCFDKEGLSPAEIAKRIVEHCTANDIAGIAVTDHLTGAAVDTMKDAAKGSGVTVFPGIEFALSGGERRIHIIGIFDLTHTSEKLTAILSRARVQGDLGSEEAFCSLDHLQLAQLIRTEGGLVILPHPYSSSGVLGEQRGTPRQVLMDSGLVCAVEYHENVSKYYGRIAQYRASDGGICDEQPKHMVKGIGSPCSLFSMETVDFEALRQCLVDPDSRIHVSSEAVPTLHPCVESFRVKNGFLDGLDLQFHTGLNALLGGKGVGKSLVIEFLRFALDQAPPKQIKEVHSDHLDKLKKRLGHYGTVEVEFRGIDGRRYHVKRIFDGGDNRAEVTDLETSGSVEVSLRSLLPMMVFSQREIMLMAENDQARRDWFDLQLGVAALETTANETLAELRQSDSELAAAIQASRDCQGEGEQIALLQNELNDLRAKADHPIAEHMDKVRKQAAVFKDIVGYHRKISAVLQRAEDAIVAFAEPPLPADSNQIDLRLRVSHQAAVESLRRTLGVLRETRRQQDAVSAAQENLMADFKRTSDPVEREYEKVMGTLDTNAAQLHADRVRVEKKLESLIRGNADNAKAADTLAAVYRRRASALRRLMVAHSARSASRERKLNALNARANGRLRISINKNVDVTAYDSKLADLKTSIPSKTLSKISTSVPIQDFMRHCLRRDSRQIARKTGIASATAEKLVQSVAQLPLLTQLEWQYTVVPEDTILVEYQVSADPEVYVSLEELSVGQKSSAMTVMALLQEYTPVVIDQPEDSLDIQGVWKDVTQPVRHDKAQRQFIFTTHNSTLAVAADSDVFIILKAEAQTGQVAHVGAIENEAVKHSVIQHVEGGRDAYNLKREKYGGAVE